MSGERLATPPDRRKPLRILGITDSVSPPVQNKTPRSQNFATVGFKLLEKDSNLSPRGYEPPNISPLRPHRQRHANIAIRVRCDEWPGVSGHSMLGAQPMSPASDLERNMIHSDMPTPRDNCPLKLPWPQVVAASKLASRGNLENISRILLAARLPVC